MKKFALVGAFAAVAACTPDIPQTAPQDHAIVVFDPVNQNVPTPNDLAIDPTTGLVKAPTNVGSPANQEFTKDYLNTLDGFPAGSAAAATVQPVGSTDVDPASVNAGSVLVNDLTLAAGGGNPSVAATVQYDPSSHQIVVLPPNGAWTKGHKYEVAVLSGPSSGVQIQGGGQVYGSAVWTLARSSTPLVACNGNVCQPTQSLVSNVDQAKQLEQLRLAYAPLLDALQAAGVSRDTVASLWTFTITSMPEMRFDPTNSVIPFPNDLVTKPLADGGLQVNLPYPASAILPDGGVDLTNPQAQLVYGLNTLDGFSTTAPIVTENSDDGSALTDGALINPASVVNGQTVGVIPLVDPSTIPPQDIQPCVYPDMAGCSTSSALPDGGYSPLPDGGVQPQQLQFVPVKPLEGHTPYGAFVSTAVMSQNGKHVAPTTAFALFRLSNSLVDGSGHSTIPGVSDAQAQAIEPARAALKPFFDALDQQGIHRKDLALAWNFNTESTVSILQQLATYPTAAGLPDVPITMTNADVVYRDCGGSPGASNCPYPTADIGHVFTGTLVDANLLTGPGQTLNPTQPSVRPIPFLFSIPTGSPPATGWPVVMFGHGLTRNRTDALAFADSLAKAGFAMIAIDEVFHGDRVSCTGVGAFLSSQLGKPYTDDSVCTNGGVCNEALPVGRCVAGPGPTDYGQACTYLSPSSSTGGGDLWCQSQGQGACVPTANLQPGPSKCEGSDFTRDATGQPALNTGLAPPYPATVQFSGWNIFNLSNLFTTRDNFRQQVVDDAQVEKVATSSSATSLNVQLNALLGTSGTTYLDTSTFHYSGQSLGGILGTLYTAADPNVHRSFLNVPAGDLLRIFFTSPNSTLQGLSHAFINALGQQGIVAGTPGFDDFLGLARMILDPADPVNAAYATSHGSVPSDREVLFQWIEGDQFLPNPTAQELVNAAIRDPSDACATNTPNPPAPCAASFEFTQAYSDANGGACALPTNLDNRHGFLLNGAATVTACGQTQGAAFLNAGVIQTGGL